MTKHLAIIVLAALAATARADGTDDALVAKGEEAARQGDYTRSIAMFKAADAQQPTARNACMIGLAYLRRELWAQAEVFFTSCRRRSTAADTLPDWLPEAEAQLATKLAAVDVAPIEIHVTPSDASISISSFPPDERFPPSTVHLAPGKHVIEASAPGYETASTTIEVVAHKTQTLEITLHHPLPPPSRVPLYVMGGGVALGVAATLYTIFAVKPVYDELGTTMDRTRYDELAATMRSRRVVEGALIGGAVVAVGVGVVLRYTVFARRPEESVRVSAQADAHGAAIAVGWSY